MNLIKKIMMNIFLNVEAHRTNYGNLNNFNLDYIFKTLFLIITILLYLKYYKNQKTAFFIKTLLTSIILSGVAIFLYKIPKIFPEIKVQGMLDF